MKNVKMLTTAIALTVATSASIQANELVKVDTLDNTALTINVTTELAQSFKEMSLVTLNVEKSAETILVDQNEKQFKALEAEPTLVAVAE